MAARAADQIKSGYTVSGKVDYRTFKVYASETANGVTTRTATYCQDITALKLIDSSGRDASHPVKTFLIEVVVTKLPGGNWIVSADAFKPTPC